MLSERCWAKGATQPWRVRGSHRRRQLFSAFIPRISCSYTLSQNAKAFTIGRRQRSGAFSLGKVAEACCQTQRLGTWLSNTAYWFKEAFLRKRQGTPRHPSSRTLLSSACPYGTRLSLARQQHHARPSSYGAKDDRIELKFRMTEPSDCPLAKLGFISLQGSRNTSCILKTTAVKWPTKTPRNVSGAFSALPWPYATASNQGRSFVELRRKCLNLQFANRVFGKCPPGRVETEYVST